MTTNRPEDLDDALIRPGRVDLQVAFSNATPKQTKELFERMYTKELPQPRLHLPPSPSKALAPQFLDDRAHLKKELTPPATPTTTGDMSLTSSTGTSEAAAERKLVTEIAEEIQGKALSELAVRFAEQVPDALFSPAELQGFLLKRKNDPRKACNEIGKWVEGMLEVKKVGGKLVPQ